jgi:hypothetical protein
MLPGISNARQQNPFLFTCCVTAFDAFPDVVRAYALGSLQVAAGEVDRAGFTF